MDLYHVWCDLKPGVRDLEFSAAVDQCMRRLEAERLIAGWRLTRRKLGFGPPALGEWHLMLELHDLAQLDAAFARLATRSAPEEGLHAEMNACVRNATFALTRDFPDPGRRQGEERF
jgi:hypothetical protein